MIIEARGDVLTLSGSLDRNLWPSIESAASLLLRLHPSGILIDANGLTNITADGAKTFLDAMAYIERYRARIVLCQVPDSALEVIRNVPGLRSQVSVSATCEEARTSLELAAAARAQAGRTGRRAVNADGSGGLAPCRVLVPLLRGASTPKEAVALAMKLGATAGERAESRSRTRVPPQITVSYILQVPRTMPLTAPSPEEEEAAREMLNDAQEALLATGAHAQTDVARTRDVSEEIVAQAARIKADLIVMAMPSNSDKESGYESFEELLTSLMNKAPCELVLKR